MSSGATVTGWALIYMPHLPKGFLPAPGLPYHERHGFFTATYISLSSLTTLSAGDLTAQTNLGHTLSITEGLIGQVYLVTVVAVIWTTPGPSWR